MFEKKKKGSAHLKKEEKRSAPPAEEQIYENPEDYAPEEEIYDDYIPGEEYPAEEPEYSEDEYTEDEYAQEPQETLKKKKSSRKEKKSEKAPKAKKVKKEKIKKEKKKSKKAAAEELSEEAIPVKPKMKHKKLKITLICILLVLILAFAGATYWAYTISHSNINLPKVYVDGVFVGGMTKEQTVEALDKVDWDNKTKTPFTLRLPADVEVKLDRVDSGAIYSKEEAVTAAYGYGHSGNLYDNLIKYVVNYFSPVDVSDEFLMLDQEYIRMMVDSAVKQFEFETKDASYVVDDDIDVLRMRKGAGEMELDEDKICQKVSDALSSNAELLNYDTLEKELKMPDFDAIFKELDAEPKDAAFVGDRFEVEDEVVGCTFDVNEAKKIWEKAKPADIIEIPLEIEHPEVTGDYLRGLLYRDVLGTQTTYFKGSSDNRKNNIRLAAEAINGVILMPGEVFSYNDTVGERTKERGYSEASAYDNGEVVQEVGGGICQVSSNLYCASMFAQMDTVERTNHYFKVSYLDWGMDATVSWGTLDFKFRNSRDYPVKIVTYFDGEEESLRVDIVGTDVDGSYVEFSRSRLIINHDLYPEVVIGFTVIGYRTVYDAEGNFLRKIEEPIGIYYLHDSEINYPEVLPTDAPPTDTAPAA